MPYDVVSYVSGNSGHRRTTYSFSKQHGTGVDRHDGAFAVRILHLQCSEGLDELQGLALGLDDSLIVAARNNKEVNLRETLHGLIIGEVGAERGTLSGHDVLLWAREDGAECLGLCLHNMRQTMQSRDDASTLREG